MAPITMSAAVAMDFASAGKSSAKGFLCAPAKKPRYLRRSTTTKAPRKRSFVANMTKYSEEQLRTASVVAGVAQDAPLAHVCLDNSGGDHNNNGGNGRKLGGNGGDGGAGGDSSRLPAPALFVAAAFAVAAAFVMAPLPSMAASQLSAVHGRRVAGLSTTVSGPVRRANGYASALDAEPEVIPYGRVFLTGSEAKMLSERQYRVRETMRVYA